MGVEYRPCLDDAFSKEFSAAGSRKTLTYIVIVFFVIFLMCVMYFLGGYRESMSRPVGLISVVPDETYFKVAKETHGNYRFFYSPDSKGYYFERDGKRCFVDTYQFKKNYLREIKGKIERENT